MAYISNEISSGILTLNPEVESDSVFNESGCKILCLVAYKEKIRRTRQRHLHFVDAIWTQLRLQCWRQIRTSQSSDHKPCPPQWKVQARSAVPAHSSNLSIKTFDAGMRRLPFDRSANGILTPESNEGILCRHWSSLGRLALPPLLPPLLEKVSYGTCQVPTAKSAGMVGQIVGRQYPVYYAILLFSKWFLHRLRVCRSDSETGR